MLLNLTGDAASHLTKALNETLRVVAGARMKPWVICSEIGRNGVLSMPAGDAQRTWFPEMIEGLCVRWHHSMSIPDLIELRQQLDSMLQSIRSERHIVPPLMYCRHCKTQHRAAAPRVSVRALILALPRFGISSIDESRVLEKAWKRYRQSNRLDVYGQPVDGAAAAAPPEPCQQSSQLPQD